MRTIDNIVMRLIAFLLMAAAILKGWQLLTEPAANRDIWSYRPLLVLSVEFELGLGIWLLSGLFKRPAWLVSLVCFSLFSLVTFYKGITGAQSCGCFGKLPVNPWVTLFLIDLPAVTALAMFKPKESDILSYSSMRFLITIGCIGGIILAASAAILVLNKPAAVTSSYQVLEPDTWLGKKLPIFEAISIGDRLEKGNWVILFYHHDCPDCKKIIPEYERMTWNFLINKSPVQIAFIEVPPYGPTEISEDTTCVAGRLTNAREWFVSTPTVVLMVDGIVKTVWEKETPDLDTILGSLVQSANIAPRQKISSKKQSDAAQSDCEVARVGRLSFSNVFCENIIN